MSNHNTAYALMGVASALLIYKSVESHRSYAFQVHTLLGAPNVEQGLNFATGLFGFAGVLISLEYLLSLNK